MITHELHRQQLHRQTSTQGLSLLNSYNICWWLLLIGFLIFIQYCHNSGLETCSSFHLFRPLIRGSLFSGLLGFWLITLHAPLTDCLLAKLNQFMRQGEILRLFSYVMIFLFFKQQFYSTFNRYNFIYISDFLRLSL